MTLDQLQRLARELQEQHQAYAMVTVVRAVAPTSAYVGAQAIVCADGTLHGWIGGGCAKDLVVSAAQKAIERDEPKLLRITNGECQTEANVEQYTMACASNGSIELFVQPFSARKQLCVLGDSPAAEEARFLASRLDIPLSDSVTDVPLVLIATQGQDDEDALEAALRGPAKHVLMIASRRKAARLRDVMKARGLDARQLARLRAPAGPDAGAKTPAEIAFAAMIGVLALLRGRGLTAFNDALGISADDGNDDETGAPRKEKVINPVCGSVVSEVSKDR